jgi:acetylornithine deacetylase/succinyl-diaminopimelate desuccinylase-like protein
MDVLKAYEKISQSFDASVIPTLFEYIKIPNLSPSFNGGKTYEPETERVISLFSKWVEDQHIPKLHLRIRRLPDRTPLMYIEIPASTDYANKDDCILLYGHLDKQPPFEGWNEGFGPYSPVIKDGRLYGRGGADDGYALFGSIESIKAIQAQGLPHARVIVLIEACEESGSPDLPAHLESLIHEGLLTNVSLIVCLDSGAGSYDTFWMTTSIRGLLMTKVKVTSLTEGVHSGNGGGVCSDTFRVLRRLISAIEDEDTGKIIDDFQVVIPQKRIQQNARTCEVLGDEVWKGFPLINNIPMNSFLPLSELALNRGWRASLTVTGLDGIPSTATGGNVLRPSTTVKLSMRLPPTYDDRSAFPCLKNRMDTALPPDCLIEYSGVVSAKGWNAPDTEPWLETACENASRLLFHRDPCYAFEGGSIPFLGMLHDMFPEAQLYVSDST